jgi:hypothetical protein
LVDRGKIEGKKSEMKRKSDECLVLEKMKRKKYVYLKNDVNIVKRQLIS